MKYSASALCGAFTRTQKMPANRKCIRNVGRIYGPFLFRTVAEPLGAEKHESHGLSTDRYPTIRTTSLVMSSFFFPPRHRFTLRLAGTRYSCVTVKLSVLLTQPRIWGIPYDHRSPAIDPRPITGPKRFPMTKQYGARREISSSLLRIVIIFYFTG